LINSGARLSPEEAEYVLEVPSEPGIALPTPSNQPDSDRPSAPSLSARNQLGERLETMFTFVDAVEREDSMAVHLVRFESTDEGMRIVADPDFGKYLEAESFEPLKEILDKGQLVRWQKELKKDVERQAQRFEKDQRELIAIAQMDVVQSTREDSEEMILGLQDELSAEIRHLEVAKSQRGMSEEERSARIKTLASLRRLQSLGLIVGTDSLLINGEISLIVSEALKGARIIGEGTGTRIVVHSDSLAKPRQ